jgi:hypothetical protein
VGWRLRRAFFGQHVFDDFGIFEQLVVRVAAFGAAAAVFRLLNNVEKRVFFQEITDTPQ